MNTKFSLALIALVSVGMFALPSTMALFSGQHSFYNIDATGNQVPCVKCHGDVKAELNSGGSTVTGTKGPHADFKCEYCHRAEAGFSSGDNAYAKITYSDAANASDRIYLITTIQNFETGNFPKSITYVAGITVNNWAGSVFNTDGTPFVTDTARLNDKGQYAGSLSPLSAFGVIGHTFAYSYASEVSAYNAGSPKDVFTATATTAFNPAAVTFFANRSENLSGAGSREITPGTQYHAASLVSCLECHGGDQSKGAPGFQIDTPEPYNHANWLIDASDPASTCSNCHYSTASHTPAFEHEFAAGGFNLTTETNDTGTLEAHNDFVRASGGVLRKGYGAANDACVACHTHVAVDINFQKKYKLAFDANAFTGGAGGSGTHGTWGVGGFGAEGTVDIHVYGNGSGEVFATSNKSYNWTPTQTLYISGTDGQVKGLVSDTNDSAAALTNP